MINYVCVSDLHLGAASSLMTYVNPNSFQIDPQKPSSTLAEWVNCMDKIISETNPKGTKKPKLILNGDIMELALSNTNETAMAFEQFIKLIFPADKSPEDWIFDTEMHFLPGNHDHHLWEKARETQYINHIETLPPDSYLPIPWHTTKMYKPNPIPDYFMNGIMQRQPHLKEANVCISTIYPNYIVTNEDKSKGVIFSHGHYIESLYTLMSDLKTMIFPDRLRPQDMWDIEAENFAWIDFFWSTMGRSGEVGKDIEVIYNKMQDPKEVRKLTDNLAESIAERWQKNKFKEMATEGAMKWILGEVFERIANSERGVPHKVLDDKTKAGLTDFIEKPVLLQMRAEMGQIPPYLSFIFGHTHKPFEKMMTFSGFPQAVKVYNDGGWVVDTVEQQAFHGGAVVLVDDNLDCLSLRMYNEGKYEVYVAEAKYDTEEHSEFFKTVSSLIDNEHEPFASFCQVIEKEVGIRHAYLRSSVES